MENEREREIDGWIKKRERDRKRTSGRERERYFPCIRSIFRLDSYLILNIS